MAHTFGNDDNEHGSAGIATESELEAAGVFDFAEDAVYCGKAYGRRLWFKSPGGILLVAGARMGKLTDILAQNICHSVLSAETLIICDIKGELAAISRDQTPDRKHCIYWNPLGLFDLPVHRINTLGHLRWSSPTLVSDIKLYFAGQLRESGAGSARYFELNGRRVGEGLARSCAETNGVVTLPALYDAILALQAGGALWSTYAEDMKASSARDIRAFAAEIETAQVDSSGGWRGIVGELMQAFACLSDPELRSSVSEPFDFQMEDLPRSGQLYHFYLICPELLVEQWAPVVKTFLTTARTLKARAPSAPRQTWIIDEAARFKGYGEIADLYTVGAGLGIRPFAVFQDVSQMNDLAPNAQRKIMSSAAVQIYFGARDLASSKHISEMLGVETLRRHDPVVQGRARLELRKLAQSVFEGRGLFDLVFEVGQKRFESTNPNRERRMLRNPDEVMRMAPGHMYLFADGLSGAVYGEREPYWTQRWMAGRYHPNPYHPPLDGVTVQTRWGPRWRRVFARKVPEAYADYPQYADGIWTMIGEASR